MACKDGVDATTRLMESATAVPVPASSNRMGWAKQDDVEYREDEIGFLCTVWNPDGSFHTGYAPTRDGAYDAALQFFTPTTVEMLMSDGEAGRYAAQQMTGMEKAGLLEKFSDEQMAQAVERAAHLDHPRDVHQAVLAAQSRATVAKSKLALNYYLYREVQMAGDTPDKKGFKTAYDAAANELRQANADIKATQLHLIGNFNYDYSIPNALQLVEEVDKAGSEEFEVTGQQWHTFATLYETKNFGEATLMLHANAPAGGFDTDVRIVKFKHQPGGKMTARNLYP